MGGRGGQSEISVKSSKRKLYRRERFWEEGVRETKNTQKQRKVEVPVPRLENVAHFLAESAYK